MIKKNDNNRERKEKGIDKNDLINRVYNYEQKRGTGGQERNKVSKGLQTLRYSSSVILNSHP